MFRGVSALGFNDLFDSFKTSSDDAEVLKVTDCVVVTNVVSVAEQTCCLLTSLLLYVGLISGSDTYVNKCCLNEQFAINQSINENKQIYTAPCAASESEVGDGRD